MKKIMGIILCLIMLLAVVGCKSSVVNNNSDKSLAFSQTMTIARTPSPIKCKTFDSHNTIEDVLEVLSQIKKGETVKGNDTNGALYFIELNVDGVTLNYVVGDIFTDADGKQYKVLNYEEIEKKLDTIYDEIDTQEVDYQ